METEELNRREVCPVRCCASGLEMVGSSLEPRSVDGPEKLWRHGNKFPKELLEGPGPPLLGFHPVSCISELVSVEL